MNISTLLSTRHWPIFAMVFSASMLVAAHGFENFANMAPCELCLRQREAYWAALLVSGIFVILQASKRFRWTGRGGLAILGLVFLTGALIAGFHAGVEWKFWPGPTSCSGQMVDLTAISGDLLQALDAPVTGPRCDEAPWVMLGISMAGWNALISLILAGISFKLALFQPQKEVVL